VRGQRAARHDRHGPPIEPVTANKGAAACAALDQGGSLPATPLPVNASGFFARTGLTGPADKVEQQTVSATGGLADISIPLVPGVPGLPAPQLPPQLGSGVIDVPGIGMVDLRPAIAALTAPTGDLIHVGAFTATARGRCSAGNPALSGSSDIASLSVLGQTIATDKAIEKAITIDSRSIDPSNLDLSKAIAPAGVDLSQLQAQLKPLLDQFPNIEIPAAVAHLKISPNRDIRTADALTRRALELELSLGGQNVLDLVLGEATVSSAGVSCGSIAAAALGCTKRKLTLIDVVRHGNRVSVLGAADARRFAGRKVDLVSSWNGKTVAHPTVGRDGLFRARLRLPPARLRGTNRARYEARLGRRALAEPQAGAAHVHRRRQGQGPQDHDPRPRHQAAGQPAPDDHGHAAGLMWPGRGRQALQAAPGRHVHGHADRRQDAARGDVPVPHEGSLRPLRQEAAPDVHAAALHRDPLAGSHRPGER
jgi:hypothetical protein